jgi:hypothetical protein
MCGYLCAHAVRSAISAGSFGTNSSSLLSDPSSSLTAKYPTGHTTVADAIRPTSARR